VNDVGGPLQVNVVVGEAAHPSSYCSAHVHLGCTHRRVAPFARRVMRILQMLEASRKFFCGVKT
jgi:hypothetical protein